MFAFAFLTSPPFIDTHFGQKSPIRPQFAVSTYSLRILLIIILFLLPLAAYWNTTFHSFGFRDDYSNLHEARDEPGKIIQFTASHARPLYGALLQLSFENIDSVTDLSSLRFIGAIGLGIISGILFGALLRLGWHTAQAAFVAAMISLTPSAQVIISWATAWPYTAAAILSISGFMLANFSSEKWRLLSRAGAILLIAIGALIYQPSSLLYFTGVAASAPLRRARSLGPNLYWLGAHLCIVFAGLSIAFLTMKICYATGVFEASTRISLEHNPFRKLQWFLQEPLLNALNIFILNDENAKTWQSYRAEVQITALLIIAGAAIEWLRHGWQTGIFWLILLTILPPAAYSVNLVVSDYYAAYRTLFALSSVLLIIITLSWKNLCDLLQHNSRLTELVGYSLMLVLAVFLARSHAYELIAVPQGHELQVLQRACDQIMPFPNRQVRIYFVPPSPNDRLTEISYHGEFGSFSTDNDWLPKIIFEELLHERLPRIIDRTQRYQMQVGIVPPLDSDLFDLTIDMRAALLRFNAPRAELEKEPERFYLYRLTDYKRFARSSLAFQSAKPGFIPHRGSCTHPMTEMWQCPATLSP